MKIKVIDSIEKLLFYKAEWESILKEMNNDIMFLELDWIIYWWKFFGDKHNLFVLIVINDQETVGICPLMITNRGINNEINFIGGRKPGKMDFILRAEFREEILQCIYNFLRSLKGRNIIELHGMTERSTNYISLKEYLKMNKVSFVSSVIMYYFINLKDNDINTRIEQRFSKRTREKMKSNERKLKRLGNLAYRKISSSEMDDVFEIHEKRWSRKIGSSSFSKEGTKEFYKELASNKNMKFNISVDAITLNNNIISFIYGFEYKGKILLFRIAHDDDFCFLSPGILILKKKIEECLLSQMSVLDFGPGNDPYKARWSDDYEKVSGMTFPSNSLQAKLIFYVKYWTRIKLIDAMKKNKRIYNFKKYSLGKLKFLFSRAYISDRILKMKRNVNQNGLPLYLVKCFNDLTSIIFSYKQYLLLERDLTNLEVARSTLQVKEATIDDLKTLSQVMNESPSKIIRRFINKHKCFITLVGGEVTHYCWINCSNIEISSVALGMPLKKFEVHIYDVFMEKKYRNEHNYIAIFSHIFNLLYRENYRRCYITLNSFSKSFENEIYKKIFHPSYKILEKRVFSRIKHSMIDLKLSGKC